MRAYWWVGAVLPLAAALGCADEAPPEQPLPDFHPTPISSNPASPAAEQPAQIDGFWATYANDMDGTTVALHTEGSKLTGRGCLAGWVESPTPDPSVQCGDISGTIDGDQVSFQFFFGQPGPWDTYAVHAQLLEGDVRMTGEHSYYTAGSPMPQPEALKSHLWSGPVTVFRPLRPAADQLQWPFSAVPTDVRRALDAAPQVRLLGDAPEGAYSPGTDYELRTAWGGLRGKLGVFAPVDLSYDLTEPGVIVVHAGPAPQPEPNTPVALTIAIRDQQVVSVEAELADGQKLSFAP